MRVALIVAVVLASCLKCIIENCAGLYLSVKGDCGSSCTDFDTCMAGCGS